MHNTIESPHEGDVSKHDNHRNTKSKTDPSQQEIIIERSLLCLSDAAVIQATENRKTLKQSLLPRSCITAEIHPITTNEHAGTTRASGLGPALGTPLKINGLDRHHGSKKSLKRNHHNLKRWLDLVLCV